MKKYITNLYGHGTSSTAMNAQNLVVTIAEQERYSEIKIGPYLMHNETENDKIKRIECILSGVSSHSLVIAQMPSWDVIAFDELLLQALRIRVEKLVVFVHDFVSLMFQNNDYRFDRYILSYNVSDLMILPAKKMKEILTINGLNTFVIYQEIWDCQSTCSFLGHPKFKTVIKFSGNTERFPFAKSRSKTVPLEGRLSNSELLRALNEGGFSLE